MFKRVHFFSFLLVQFVLSVLFPRAALAQKAWGNINPKCVASGDVATIQGLECLFYNILQVIVYIAGIAFFIMFIVGGFNYLFSSNDQKKVAAASSTLTMAIVGLVGVIASWLILLFIQNFTGINVTNFTIPGP